MVYTSIYDAVLLERWGCFYRGFFDSEREMLWLVAGERARGCSGFAVVSLWSIMRVAHARELRFKRQNRGFSTVLASQPDSPELSVNVAEGVEGEGGVRERCARSLLSLARWMVGGKEAAIGDAFGRAEVAKVAKR